MRVAWFSPLPPAATGIAGYSAEILPLLDRSFAIDRYDEPNAHEFVWRNRRAPYDLVVYQVGNSRWHDYMWAYMFRYPGLVVLHDARLHHARAAQLLREQRADDYRREFAYDHPDASLAAEYAAQGLLGSPLYLWPMNRAVVDTARLVCVHSAFVADELRRLYPNARVDRIRLGVAPMTPSADARNGVRRRHDIPGEAVVFVAFGLMTREKRIEPILLALASLVSRGVDVHLLLVGASELPDLADMISNQGVSRHVRIAGFVADEDVADYLAAADAVLSLRWPTAQETSASWIKSLASAKPTVITSLPHTADVPAIDATTWTPTRRSKPPVAVRVDLLDEEAGIRSAMSRLTEDRSLRQSLGRAGYEYWKAEHEIGLMADDYRRAIASAAALDAPKPRDLPAHLTNDYSELVESIAREIGVKVEWPSVTAKPTAER